MRFRYIYVCVALRVLCLHEFRSEDVIRRVGVPAEGLVPRALRRVRGLVWLSIFERCGSCGKSVIMGLVGSQTRVIGSVVCTCQVRPR